MEVQLKKIIAEHLGVEENEIHPTSRLADDLGADSLDFIELSITIDDRFGVELDDEQLEGVKTFGDLLTLVSK